MTDRAPPDNLPPRLADTLNRFPVYPERDLANPAFARCSLGAGHLFHIMRCLAFGGRPCGHVTDANGRALKDPEIVERFAAAILRGRVKAEEILPLFKELFDLELIGRDNRTCCYTVPDMVHYGQAVTAGRETGGQGGNPLLGGRAPWFSELTKQLDHVRAEYKSLRRKTADRKMTADELAECTALEKRERKLSKRVAEFEQ